MVGLANVQEDLCIGPRGDPFFERRHDQRSEVCRLRSCHAHIIVRMRFRQDRKRRSPCGGHSKVDAFQVTIESQDTGQVASTLFLLLLRDKGRRVHDQAIAFLQE